MTCLICNAVEAESLSVLCLNSIKDKTLNHTSFPNSHKCINLLIKIMTKIT